MKEHNVTSEPQTAFIPTANEVTADSAAKPMPLDRSSEEWRSQFGVLPSQYRRGSTMRPVPGQVRDTAAGAVETTAKPNRFSLLVAIVGMILVGGLMVYGYFPSRQVVSQQKVEKSSDKAVAALGEKQRKPARAIPSRAANPETVAVAVSLSTPSTKRAVKRTGKPVREARRTARPALPKSPLPERAPQVRRPKTITPRPARETEKNVRPTSVQTAAARMPRAAPAVPERSPTTAPKTAARTAPAAQPLPKVAPPSPKGAESGGTNPLGLPL